MCINSFLEPLYAPAPHQGSVFASVCSFPWSHVKAFRRESFECFIQMRDRNSRSLISMNSVEKLSKFGLYLNETPDGFGYEDLQNTRHLDRTRNRHHCHAFMPAHHKLEPCLRCIHQCFCFRGFFSMGLSVLKRGFWGIWGSGSRRLKEHLCVFFPCFPGKSSGVF